MPNVNNIIYNKASKKEDNIPYVREPEKLINYPSIKVKAQTSSLKE